jgi:hypothetical protein
LRNVDKITRDGPRCDFCTMTPVITIYRTDKPLTMDTVLPDGRVVEQNDIDGLWGACAGCDAVLQATDYGNVGVSLRVIATVKAMALRVIATDPSVKGMPAFIRAMCHAELTRMYTKLLPTFVERREVTEADRNHKPSLYVETEPGNEDLRDHFRRENGV